MAGTAGTGTGPCDGDCKLLGPLRQIGLVVGLNDMSEPSKSARRIAVILKQSHNRPLDFREQFD
jgi:hypothetical protein